jgi:hypothetical protein
MNRRRITAILSTALVTTAVLCAPAAFGFGIGLQTGTSFGGLYSLRDWLSPTFGIELILYVAGETGTLEGQLTGRVLSWIYDARTIGLYAAGGLTHPFPDGGISGSLVGGLEFGVPFSDRVTWNLEMGASLAVPYRIEMTMGFGVHYYLHRS